MLLRKIDGTVSYERKKGSGRPKSVRVKENIEAVQYRILSQDDKPATHKTTNQISAELGISRSGVRNIIIDDLLLKTVKRIHGQKLMETNFEKR